MFYRDDRFNNTLVRMLKEQIHVIRCFSLHFACVHVYLNSAGQGPLCDIEPQRVKRVMLFRYVCHALNTLFGAMLTST